MWFEWALYAQRGTRLGTQAVSPAQFSTFGDLLKYLRRRQALTQQELALQIGCSDTQISRFEQNQRLPGAAALSTLFIPALHLEREGNWASRLFELARQAPRGAPPDSRPAENTPPPNNLPGLLTSFIGRERDIAEVKQWLKD